MPDNLAIVLEKMSKKYRDNLFQKTPLLDALWANQDPTDPTTDTYSLRFPIELNEHSRFVEQTVAGQGYAALNQNYASIFDHADFEVFHSEGTIGISGREKKDAQDSPESLVSRRIKNVISMGMRQIEERMISGAVGNGFNGVSTLNGATGITTGFFEEVAPAAQVNTVGGVTKVDPQWINNVQTAGGAFAVNGLNAINRLHIAASNRAEVRRTMLLLSDTCYALFLAEVETGRRYTSKEKADSGRIQLISSDGYEVAHTPHLGFNSTLGVPVSGYMIDLSGIRWVGSKSEFMQFQKDSWTRGTGQNVMQGFVLTRGQLCADRISASGVLLNAEA